jgi:peptidoglycan/xylan/chitin deacetylase (PgdA/CDA1 family)
MNRLALIGCLALAGVLIACSGGSPSVTPTAIGSGTPSPAASPIATRTATAAVPTVPPATATSPPAPSPTPTPPASHEPALVVQRGPGQRKAVTLTFDAGSDPGYTSLILDTLAANNIIAAFGITGRWAEENPGLLQRIAADGHELINHSYDHSSFTGLSTASAPLTQAERWQQIDRTEAAVQRFTGSSTLPYFRPPYGDWDASVNLDVGLRGYVYNVMWTIDSWGWRGIPAQEIVARCLDLAAAGAIYIFHVGSASQDGFALQAVIDGLRAAGYNIVPLSEMLP